MGSTCWTAWTASREAWRSLRWLGSRSVLSGRAGLCRGRRVSTCGLDSGIPDFQFAGQFQSLRARVHGRCRQHDAGFCAGGLLVDGRATGRDARSRQWWCSGCCRSRFWSCSRARSGDSCTGLSPMQADRGHFHHRLLDAGFSVQPFLSCTSASRRRPQPPACCLARWGTASRCCSMRSWCCRHLARCHGQRPAAGVESAADSSGAANCGASCGAHAGPSHRPGPERRAPKAINVGPAACSAG